MSYFILVLALFLSSCGERKDISSTQRVNNKKIINSLLSHDLEKLSKRPGTSDSTNKSNLTNSLSQLTSIGADSLDINLIVSNSNTLCDQERKSFSGTDIEKLKLIMGCFESALPSMFFLTSSILRQYDFRDRFAKHNFDFQALAIEVEGIMSKNKSEREAVKVANESILATVLDEIEFFSKFSHINRYQLLVEYAKAFGRYRQEIILDTLYSSIAKYRLSTDIRDVFKSEGLDIADFYFTNMEYSYGIYGFLVAQNQIELPMTIEEHPVFINYSLITDEDKLFNYISTKFRELDSDQLINEVEYFASDNSVNVVFYDTGFTFDLVPELLAFNDKADMIDFHDFDTNPYSISEYDFDTIEGMAHGTKTAGEFLQLLGRFNPNILIDSGLDLGFVRANFNETMTPFKELNQFSNDTDIISISMGFHPYDNMNKEMTEDLADFKDRKELLIMGAGNDGYELGKPKKDSAFRGCFEDVPDDLINRDQIICVGALEEGVIGHSLAYYTNYGELVDFYVFDSHAKICESGTSCATPGVTYAATLLKSRYPELTAKDMKSILVNTAMERSVKIPSSHELYSKHKNIVIKYFDPVTMESNMYLEAEKYLSDKSDSLFLQKND